MQININAHSRIFISILINIIRDIFPNVKGNAFSGNAFRPVSLQILNAESFQGLDGRERGVQQIRK
jgi:hypothetical protein